MAEDFSGTFWRNASEFRADTSQLPDADVQATVSRLVREGGFDELHSARPQLTGLLTELRDRAVDALLAQGRDPEQRRTVVDYVDRDLWARFPLHTAEYEEQIDRMTRLGLQRTPEHSATLTRAVFINDRFVFGSGSDPKDPALRGVPSRVELEVFHQFVSVLVSSYHVGVPGDRSQPPGWRGSWLMLTQDWELVPLSSDAVSAEILHPDFVEPIRYVAIAFQEWQSVRASQAYQVGMRLGHDGAEPMPRAIAPEDYALPEWRRGAERRAESNPLPNPVVQSCITAIIGRGGFDELQDGRPDQEPLRDALRRLAVATLHEAGRGERSALAEYVDHDIRVRFPVFSPALLAARARVVDAGYTRVPDAQGGPWSDVYARPSADGADRIVITRTPSGQGATVDIPPRSTSELVAAVSDLATEFVAWQMEFSDQTWRYRRHYRDNEPPPVAP